MIRDAPIRAGLILLEPKSTKVLGGRVEGLAETWETNRRFGGTTNRPGLPGRGWGR